MFRLVMFSWPLPVFLDSIISSYRPLVLRYDTPGIGFIGLNLLGILGKAVTLHEGLSSILLPSLSIYFFSSIFFSCSISALICYLSCTSLIKFLTFEKVLFEVIA